MGRIEPLDLVIYRDGREDGRLRVEADPQDHDRLRELLLAHMDRKHRLGAERLDEFAMDVFNQHRTDPMFRFAASREA